MNTTLKGLSHLRDFVASCDYLQQSKSGQAVYTLHIEDAKYMIRWMYGWTDGIEGGWV